MIKIIKEGNKNQTYHVNCYHCGCEFTCQDEDCYQTLNLTTGSKGINCPCCGNPLTVSQYTPMYNHDYKITCDERGQL